MFFRIALLGASKDLSKQKIFPYLSSFYGQVFSAPFFIRPVTVVVLRIVLARTEWFRNICTDSLIHKKQDKESLTKGPLYNYISVRESD